MISSARSMKRRSAATRTISACMSPDRPERSRTHKELWCVKARHVVIAKRGEDDVLLTKHLPARDQQAVSRSGIRARSRYAASSVEDLQIEAREVSDTSEAWSSRHRSSRPRPGLQSFAAARARSPPSAGGALNVLVERHACEMPGPSSRVTARVRTAASASRHRARGDQPAIVSRSRSRRMVAGDASHAIARGPERR